MSNLLEEYFSKVMYSHFTKAPVELNLFIISVPMFYQLKPLTNKFGATIQRYAKDCYSTLKTNDLR